MLGVLQLVLLRLRLLLWLCLWMYEEILIACYKKFAVYARIMRLPLYVKVRVGQNEPRCVVLWCRHIVLESGEEGLRTISDQEQFTGSD